MDIRWWLYYLHMTPHLSSTFEKNKFSLPISEEIIPSTVNIFLHFLMRLRALKKFQRHTNNNEFGNSVMIIINTLRSRNKVHLLCLPQNTPGGLFSE